MNKLTVFIALAIAVVLAAARLVPLDRHLARAAEPAK
jgi:hypothetical protein